MAKKDNVTEKDQATMEQNEAKDTVDATNEDQDTAQDIPVEQAELSETEKLEAQIAETKDKYIRLVAEFDNFRKRTMKERLELMKTAAQDTMTALLPIMDDFDRAKKTADDDNSAEQFSEGVNLVYSKFNSVLKQRGLEVMDINAGDVFDLDLHEAITEIPAPTEEMKGKIIDVIEKGYTLKDKIIRYAKVVVGK